MLLTRFDWLPWPSSWWFPFGYHRGRRLAFAAVGWKRALKMKKKKRRRRKEEKKKKEEKHPWQVFRWGRSTPMGSATKVHEVQPSDGEWQSKKREEKKSQKNEYLDMKSWKREHTSGCSMSNSQQRFSSHFSSNYPLSFKCARTNMPKQHEDLRVLRSITVRIRFFPKRETFKVVVVVNS